MIHELIEAQIETGSYALRLAQIRSEFNRLFLEEQAELGDLPSIAESVVESYFRYYAEDGLTYPVQRRGRRTEIKVQVDLSNSLRFVGYIDAMPTDEYGKTWLMDHKSCSSIPDETARYSDLQMVVYLWLLPLLGYSEPEGILWDYLRTKTPTVPAVLKSGQISKASSIDTTYDVYMDTVRHHLGNKAAKDYEEFAETLIGKEEKFYRRIYLPKPNKNMIKSVVDDLMATGKEIVEKGPEATVRNMNKDCRMCSYYDLCHAEIRGLDADYIRKTEFTTKEQRNAKEAEVINSDE